MKRFLVAALALAGGYAGTYDVAGGKQHVAIPDCIEYFIAPRGTWELMPVGAHVPESFSLAVSGNTASWTPPAGVALTLVYVLDLEFAKAKGARGPAWQTLLMGAGTHSVDLRAARMKPGHSYVVAVKLNDASMKRAGFASKAIVAP